MNTFQSCLFTAGIQSIFQEQMSREQELPRWRTQKQKVVCIRSYITHCWDERPINPPSLTFLHSRWRAGLYISHSCFIRCWPTAWNICAAREKKCQIGSVSRDRVCGVGYVKRWNVQAGKSIKRMITFFKVTAMERASRTVAVTFKIWILTFTW